MERARLEALASRPGPATALLAAATLLAHGVGLGNGFALDDGIAILQHPVVGGPAPLSDLLRVSNWGRPLGSDLTGFRPLTTLTFCLDRAISRGPLVMHAMSLAWALALHVVVWRLARRFLPPLPALAAAVVFATMGIHVDAVGGIANRGELIATTLGLGALLCALPAPGRKARPLLAAVLFGAALLGKESAFPMGATSVWWLVCVPAWRRDRRTLVAVALLALLALGYLGARSRPGPSLDQALGAPALVTGDGAEAGTPDNPVMRLSRRARLPTALALATRYLGTSLWPGALSHDHTYAAILPSRLADPLALIGLSLLLAGAGVALRDLRRGDGRAAMMLGALGVTLAFVTHVAVPLSVIYADRLFTLGSVWLALLVGLALDHLRPRVLALVLGLFVICQVPPAILQTTAWHDDVTLNVSCLEALPQNVRCHLYLARALHERGSAVEATWHFAMAALGRKAYPGPWDAAPQRKLADAPYPERLERLPALLGPPAEARAWLAALATYLDAQGALAERDLVRGMMR